MDSSVLILYRYLLSRFGVSSFAEMQEKLQDFEESHDGYLHDPVNLHSSFPGIKIPPEKLKEYISGIQECLAKIKGGRRDLRLKYFQFLALLFTEIYLDNLRHRKDEFLRELNSFLEEERREKKDRNGKLAIENYREEDLKKIAYWMATGSGKTLIMHMNYCQYLRYFPDVDGILLITPNEGLSRQHCREMEQSGIPCLLYAEQRTGGIFERNSVLVIEITKIVEEKKGGGESITVDELKGRSRNHHLIFVDEGHKGKKSEDQKWAKIRNRLAENGFVFEYSATYGQILSGKNPEVLKEYAKSIIFDYSYKHFYRDGYGKDFYTLNLKKRNLSGEEEKKFSNIMLLASLLSFYEQLRIYEEHGQLAAQHNIEKPLLVFAGTTVTGKDEESDILLILKFLQEVLEGKDEILELLKDILNGNTGFFVDDSGKDILAGAFLHIKKNFSAEDFYRRVFGGRGSLELHVIKNAPGEIGLKTKDNEYFGVITIGNTGAFLKLLESSMSGRIPVYQDVISDSLFDSIKDKDSVIRILIGSRKFMEGWDTWRVSCMGLMNIGKQQGPQIIQLFGRGVRLKGKDMSLKRNGQDTNFKVLETLYIYGIKADYLQRFLEAIQKEGNFEKLEISVERKHEKMWEKLYLPYYSKNGMETALKDKVFPLSFDDARINVTLDFTPKITAISPGENRQDKLKVETVRKERKETWRFPEEYLELLDWDSIYCDILDFVNRKNYHRLVFHKEDLRNFLKEGNYSVVFSGDFQINEKTYAELHDLAIKILTKFVEAFITLKMKEEEKDNLEYKPLKDIRYFQTSEKYQKYTIYYDRNNRESDEEVMNSITSLIGKLNSLRHQDTQNQDRQIDGLRVFYFEQMLLIPLLSSKNPSIKIQPPGLEESEEKFIEDLIRHYKDCKKQYRDYEMFLLRNYPFTGAGFHLTWHKFYPDFLMWLVKKTESPDSENDPGQILVFLDPKGLVFTKGLDDEKVRFHETIKKIEEKLKTSGRAGGISLESFLLSRTPFDKVIEGTNIKTTQEKEEKKKEFINNHVLFLEDEDWPEVLLELIFKRQGKLDSVSLTSLPCREKSRQR